MTCVLGSFCGIILSTFNDDVKTVSVIAFAFVQIITLLCGAMWPLEGQQIWLMRRFSQLLPITLPAISMRDVMIRGYGVFNKSVLIGITVQVAWITSTLIIALVALKRKTFSGI
jgi:ABC-type multidrug transport system permease subunit